MKNRFYLSALVLCIISQGKAQITRAYGMDEPNLTIVNLNISKYNVLDTANLYITYKLDAVLDTIHTNIISNDRMILQVGNHFTKFYSDNLYQNDSVCTELSKVSTDLPVNDDLYQGYEIFKDNNSQAIKVTNRLPYMDNVFVYEESLPNIKWSISDENIEVAGYNCQKAEADFLGRKYIAWFTPDIPSNSGPWKLGGLPGLILKAYDKEKQYTFECIGISQKKNYIKNYKWIYKRTTKEEWQKLERYFHEHAANYIKANNIRILVFDSNSKITPIADNWKVPYNPIEK